MLIESSDAAQDIAERAPRIIQRLLRSARPRLWLFLDGDSDLPWARRPLERFMGERYYRIDDVFISSYARLLSYAAVPAPEWDSVPVPSGRVPGHFHRSRHRRLSRPPRLHPARKVRRSSPTSPSPSRSSGVPGPRPCVTIRPRCSWSGRYTFIRAQGLDSWLGATFQTTTLIPAGASIWDNRAVLIPAEWTAGGSRLWVKLYFNDYITGQITDLLPSGAKSSTAISRRWLAPFRCADPSG
ncbi:MAG: hypothetical protein IPK52_13760 [Chloroflexi bacterium]|nr:hypothetical protein [Chloroflexota bacterium]